MSQKFTKTDSQDPIFLISFSCLISAAANRRAAQAEAEKSAAAQSRDSSDPHTIRYGWSDTGNHRSTNCQHFTHRAFSPFSTNLFESIVRRYVSNFCIKTFWSTSSQLLILFLLLLTRIWPFAPPSISTTISLEQQLDHALDHAQAATARADALQRRLNEVCVAHEAIHFTAISWEWKQKQKRAGRVSWYHYSHV